jgi:hypothetical protein
VTPNVDQSNPMLHFDELQAECRAKLAKIIHDGDVAPSALRHFTAQDGLATIRALASHAVARADGVTQNLRECERILSAAAQHGVGWHFEVDF